MTFTTTNPSNAALSTGSVATVTEQIKRLGADDQLALLWFAYTQMGRTITPAAPGAARLQFAQGLLEQFKAMSHDEQMKAMRDLVNQINSPISRSYGVLSVNTKLAFWYRLSEMMTAGTVVPVPASYRMNEATLRAFDAIQRLEFGQQITVLRSAVVKMGVDPLA
ncbi:MAG: Orange carotenoid protein [Spirulinaceae cyanobacterium SM2_1_0]|nr:Orange carotenoid protein [Spirulinaceae cyanobacterium SM2_1_0]